MGLVQSTDRFADPLIQRCGGIAVDDLIALLTNAIRIGDDGMVQRLDRVLRMTERMIDLTGGSRQDRAVHNRST